MEDKAHRQDDNHGLGNGYVRKGLDEYKDKGKEVAFLHSEQEALGECECSGK